MMMALNALAINSMLPALPTIGDALGVVDENSRQWVVTAYLLGFGVAQIIYGPLADRYGRKPILLVGVGSMSCSACWRPSRRRSRLLIAAPASAPASARRRCGCWPSRSCATATPAGPWRGSCR